MTLGWRRSVVVAFALLLEFAACRSGGSTRVDDLAAERPMHYSVLVSGGAFIEPGADNVPWRQRTYRPVDAITEAFPLSDVADLLRRARVFVRVEQDEQNAAARAHLAHSDEALSIHDAELQGVLAAARRSGHDFVLVLERVRDRAIENRGVNGQWPITAAVWLLIGLGMLIPDHTYESLAELHVVLRDVITGRAVYRSVLRGGAMDLALVERSDFLGLVTSIVVPPFLVGDDAEAVEAAVRATASERLLVALARQLKTRDAESRIASALPVTLDVDLGTDAVTITVEGEAAISIARFVLDGRALDAVAAAALQTALLQSAESAGAKWRYRARLEPLPAGRFLQVIVQTVTGSTASATVALVP